jgi:pimeloyl-ACP methyl ester carboxylesterase
MGLTTLGPALDGERIEIGSAAGRIAFYAAGAGPPMLLVHSVNAAASAAEVRPLYDHFRATHTVFAPDLPGYGFSDRSDRDYTPRLMTDALHAVAAAIGERCGAVPVDALAVSLSCEFLARAAVEQPARYRRLALVSPTGLRGGQRLREAAGRTRAMPWFLAALRGPGWGGALFRGLTRPGVVRYFLERTWGSKGIDERLWRYCVATARQPGAEHAPLHFLSGGLFSTDIHDVYERLAMPVWVAHGDRGDFTDYRGKDFLERRPNWRFTVFPAGALPYFEMPDAFLSAWAAASRDDGSPP